VAWPDPPPATAAAKFLQGGLTEFADVIVRYGLVVGVAHALSYRRLLREGERRAATLEDRLAQGELRLLTLQLQPQFLFDTLRAVGDRVESDPRDAERMLARLSDLLRLVLESEDRQEVTLEEELDALAPYVKVQQMRLGGGLRVTPEVEAGAFVARVPNLVLQPLVDHALRHANARRPGREAIAIRARRRNGNLELEVRDDGPGDGGAPLGVAPAAPAPDLLSTRIRLRQMYGPEHRLEVSDLPGGGVRVAVEIPWRADPPEPAPGSPPLAASLVRGGRTR
jgi:LytS/YehU family sensor histidine kinase